MSEAKEKQTKEKKEALLQIKLGKMGLMQENTMDRRKLENQPKLLS